MAAAGMFAIQHQRERLKTDHENAKAIAGLLQHRTEVTTILPVETNIVIFYLDPAWGNSAKWVQKAAEKGILCAPFGTDAVRMVTHLDFSNDDLLQFFKKINSY